MELKINIRDSSWFPNVLTFQKRILERATVKECFKKLCYFIEIIS
jgi:hypothetical protein